MEEIIQPIAKELLMAELTPERRLRITNKSNNEIYIVNAHNSPNTMREIGRLREIAFRTAGGGTGKEVDLDEFDTMTEYETNFRNKIGEIDVIAQDGDYIVFVEVKARNTKAFGNPLEAINIHKQQKIRNVASIYLMQNKKTNSLARFDAISIVGVEDLEIDHIMDAF